MVEIRDGAGAKPPVGPRQMRAIPLGYIVRDRTLEVHSSRVSTMARRPPTSLGTQLLPTPGPPLITPTMLGPHSREGAGRL